MKPMKMCCAALISLLCMGGPEAMAAQSPDPSAVQKQLQDLQTVFPQGMAWDDYVRYENDYAIGYGCMAFAMEVQDLIYGTDSVPVIEKDFAWEDIQAGDHIRFYNRNHGEHSAIVTEKKGDTITIAEGNYNDSVSWSRTMDKNDLKHVFIYRESRNV